MCNTPILPVPVVVHWDGRFLCVQFEHLYFVNFYYILKLLLPKIKIRCIIEKQTLVRFLGRADMNAFDELKELANSTSRPDDAASFILCVLEALKARGELAQRPQPYPAEHYPTAP